MRLTLIVIASLVVVIGAVYLYDRPAVDQSDQRPSGIMCTMEAKLCPDGSYVGRTGPKCEFAACPGATSTPSTTSGR